MPLPTADAEIAGWVRGLGLPGLVDLHVHFLPEPVLRKVWGYFDHAQEHYGMPWPVRYKLPEAQRLAALRSFGVLTFAPLVYPHKPGMAEWLTGWVTEFAEREPDAVPTATFFPEPDAPDYLGKALAGGARCVKAHVQVGRYDPRDAALTPVWGLLAEAGVPVVVHCGHGPLRGAHTGLDVFGEVLARHPRLTAVLAHAGMPEFDLAFDLVQRYPRVHLDTTMVGTAFTQSICPLPADWAARLAGIADRVALGTDFPNIPYGYVEQIAAIAGWAERDERLGEPFLRRVLFDTPAALLGVSPAQGVAAGS